MRPNLLRVQTMGECSRTLKAHIDSLIRTQANPNIQVDPVEPSSVEEALQHECWTRAMHTELDAIERNKTWTLVPRPPKRKIVSMKWIFKTKYKADNSLDKHKARIVARGFT